MEREGARLLPRTDKARLLPVHGDLLGSADAFDAVELDRNFAFREGALARKRSFRRIQR